MTDSKSASDRHARAARRTAHERGAGLAGAALAAALLAWIAGPMFAEPLFDAYQRWSPRPIPATRVLVVRIDAESLEALGPWPWPRSYLARLSDRLRDGGAAAVGYDLLFAESDPSNPVRFADAFPALSPSALRRGGGGCPSGGGRRSRRRPLASTTRTRVVLCA